MGYVGNGTALSKIKSPAVNLADTFAFSGTVTGFDKTPLTLLSTFTSDGSDATASFTSGIDSTYKEYLFVFNNIHPETNNVYFSFQCSIDSGSNYNVAVTSTWFAAYHNENDGGAAIEYGAGNDQAQATAFQYLSQTTGNENDESCSGIFRLYNPSSTTFVKHFMARTDNYISNDVQMDAHIAGYFNTTSAIDAIQFKMSSGEIQGGTISLFGVA